MFSSCQVPQDVSHRYPLTPRHPEEMVLPLLPGQLGPIQKYSCEHGHQPRVWDDSQIS